MRTSVRFADGMESSQIPFAWEAKLGGTVDGLTRVTIELTWRRSALVFHAVGESLVGDTLAAQRMAQRLTAMRDSATSQTFERAFGPWFALLDVGPASRRRDWEFVVARLEPVADALRSGAGGFIGGDTFLTWWILSQGYAETGHPESAISALESLLGQPRHRIFDWTLQGFIRPAARMRLARLYADTGQGALAQAHYAAFLATFTDPDPEVRWMVDEAQAALDTLRG